MSKQLDLLLLRGMTLSLVSRAVPAPPSALRDPLHHRIEAHGVVVALQFVRGLLEFVELRLFLTHRRTVQHEPPFDERRMSIEPILLWSSLTRYRQTHRLEILWA